MRGTQSPSPHAQDYEAIHLGAPGRTVPGVPMAPFRLGALCSAVSLSPLRPGIPVSPPRPASHGGDGCRPDTAPSRLWHGQGERLPEPGSASQVNVPLMALPSWGCAHFWAAAQPTGGHSTGVSLYECRGCQQQCQAAWGPHGSHRSQGHLLSPRVGSGETKGGGCRAALFPLFRELLYKGSSDIIH